MEAVESFKASAQTGMRGKERAKEKKKKGRNGGYGTIVESGDELALFWLRNAGSPYSVSVWSTPYSTDSGEHVWTLF